MVGLLNDVREEWSLPPYQSAIDWDHRAGHIVGQVGGEKFDHLGAILDRPEPPQGYQLGPIPIAPNAAWDHRRHDSPGGDSVTDAWTAGAQQLVSDRLLRT